MEIISSPNISGEINKCIVRVKTTVWSDKRGLYSKKSVTILRRQSEGSIILEEELMYVGANEVVPRLLNLYECDDGVYELVTCNEQRDWESGYIEDYDLKLIPIK